MDFTSLLLYCAVVTSALKHPRDFSDVQQDMRSIDVYTRNLTNWLRADYNGANNWIVPVLFAYIPLDNTLKSCTQHAIDGPPYSTPDSQTICNFIASTNYASAQKMLDAFLAAKPKFLVGNFTGGGLVGTLKQEFDYCIGNIILQAAASVRPTCSKSQTSLDQMWVAPTTLYNSTTCN